MTDARYGLSFAGRGDVLASLGGAPRITLHAEDPFAPGPHALVRGDNLEVMRLLLPAYFGRVHAIYIDPPYNTGRDFVYRDRFEETEAEFLRRTEQRDESGNPLVSNPDTSGRYHSAWLSMMYPRLWLARQLLADDGLFFVSIDDHEVHNLRALLDEIFGEDHFIAQIVVLSNRGGRDYLRVAISHEYILCYGGSPQAPVAELPKPGDALPHRDERGDFELRELRNRNPKFHPGNRPNLFYKVYVHPGTLAVSIIPREGYDVVVEPRNKAGEGSVWRWGKPKLEAAIVPDDANASEVVAKQRRDGGYNIYEKHRKKTTRPRSFWDDTAMRSEQGTIDLRRRLGDVMFDHPKPVALVRRCLELTTDPDGIVLDFFAGSGTTGEAVAQLNAADGGNRRAVLVELDHPVPEDSAAAGAGLKTTAAVARARAEASLPAGQGLRVFTAAPPASASWAGPRSPTSGEYLSALRQYEGQRERAAVSAWEVALRAGLRLDAAATSLGGDTIRFADDRVRAVVSLSSSLDADRIRSFELGPDESLWCRDHAVDDLTRSKLHGEVTLRGLGG